MLRASPTARREGAPAEEWAIHDYDGWGRYVRLDEYEALDVVVRLGTGLTEHGEAFGVWAEHVDRDLEALATFEEHYIGAFDSLEAFGEQQLDDLGFDPSELPGVPESLRPYVSIDVASWTRDLEVGGSIFSQEGGPGVYVFWSS